MFIARQSLLSLLVGLLSSLPAFAQNTPFAKKYALLIGVNTYDNANFSNLYYAERDVTELAKVLREQKYEVTLLTGAEGKKDEKHQPTRANILKQINQVMNQCKRTDLILFGFAGHGLQFKDEKVKDKDIPSFFCPMDARPNDSTTMVSLRTVYERMEDCGAAVKLMLVDACRVEVNKERFRSINGDDAPPPPKGISVLFGCKSGQAALESNELRHGLFFYHVLEGLRGKAKNGRGDVTWQRLASHAAEAVLDSGFNQVPVLRGEVEGAPVIARIEGNVDVTPTKDMTTRDGIKLTLLAPGSFQRGSEKVSIAKGFYLGTFEITQEQYRKLMGKNPSVFSPTGEGNDAVKGEPTDRFPVDSISADDAVAFCKALSTREGKTFRLPTEDEWEYACRAGSTANFHTGETLPDDRANFNRKENRLGRPAAVGTYRPNDFGLHDMHGNVAEWCASVKMPGRFALRGGSWASAAEKCQADVSLTLPSDYSNTTTGFRIVCEAK